MKTVELVAKTQQEVVDFFNLDLNPGWEDWYKGTGVYLALEGSRGELDDILFLGNVTGVVVQEKEEYVNSLIQQIPEEEHEDFKEYVDEWYGLNDTEGFFSVCTDEEAAQTYFKVA